MYNEKSIEQEIIVLPEQSQIQDNDNFKSRFMCDDKAYYEYGPQQ